jgi:WD40 repeat protein
MAVTAGESLRRGTEDARQRRLNMRAALLLALLTCAATRAGEPLTIRAGKHPAHLAFSPDGKTLAVGCGEVVKLIDPRTGKEVGSLSGHARPVHSLAFSPDGKLLATGGGGHKGGEQAGEVRVWDAATGKPKFSPAWWKGGDVQAVAFSPDGKRLAAGGLQGLRVWDVATAKLEKEVPTEGAVLALAFSPDGKELAAGAFTQYVHVWDTAAWKESVLKGHKTEVRAVCYSPDGKSLLSGGGDEVRVWDRSGKLLKSVGHPGMVYAIAFRADGKAVATAGGLPREDLAGTAVVWDPSDWSEKRRWSAKGGAVGSAEFSPGGKLLATARFDGTVVVRDPRPKTRRLRAGRPSRAWCFR